MENGINAIDITVLAAAILTGVQILRYYITSLSGEAATIIVSVVFCAIAFFVRDGLGFLELFIAIASQVFAYDFVVKPLKKIGGSHKPS